MMSSIVSSEQTIKQMRETADDSMEDYMTYYYDFSSAEALLVSQAQTGMINYYLNQLKLQTDLKQLELLQEALRSAISRRDLGLGTDVQVLVAQENIKNAEKAIQDDQSAIDTGKQRLQVLLGWTHDASPEVREIPQVDMARVAAMNPEVDKAQAVENSFSMKSNRRKLENARSQDKQEDLKETIREAEQSISASVYSGYQSVVAAQAAFELSQAQAALEQKNLAATERQFQLGNVSRMVELRHMARGKANLVAVGGVALRRRNGKLPLRQFAGQRFQERHSGVAASGDAHGLMDVSTA